MIKVLAISVAFILTFSLNVLSQTPPRPTQSRGIPTVITNSPGPSIFSERRKKPSKEQIRVIRAFKEISKEDRENYKIFLRQSNTGIFNLLPDFGCETKHVIRTSGDCKGFIPGLWTYSLRRKEYSNESFQDLGFQKDSLVSDGFLSQGILVDLGTRDLSKIALNDSGLNYLVNVVPEVDLDLISRQYEIFSEGTRQDGFLYSNRVKLISGNSYALRVIAYKFKDKKNRRLKFDDPRQSASVAGKFAVLKYDKRNDSIYVFKVIKENERRDKITVVWKRLDKKKAPKIVFEKSEKLKDFKISRN